MKQLHFLHNSGELGFSFKNRGSLTISRDSEALVNQLKQIPEIIEVVEVMGNLNLLPTSGNFIREVSSWENKPENAENISLNIMVVSPESLNFYDFQLISGEMFTDADTESMVLLNETAVRAFGWHNPVGKQFSGETFGYQSLSHLIVKGVIKHIYT